MVWLHVMANDDGCRLKGAFPNRGKRLGIRPLTDMIQPTSLRSHLTASSSFLLLQLQLPSLPAMDYSAHDPDHPGGSDPWASSPKANRQSFGQPPTSDIPSSPLPPQASPYREGAEQYGYMDQNTNSRPNTASTENGNYPQQPPTPSHDAPQQPQGQQQAPQQGQQPQRYHGTRPQRQQPHYKLQAKVTGLERNGKKDPILRFDVYVLDHL